MMRSEQQIQGSLTKLVLAGLLLASPVAKAATGWCTTISGSPHSYTFSFTPTITDPEDNQTGTVLSRVYQWNLGSTYSGVCDCTGSHTFYYKTEVPRLVQGSSIDDLTYYIINDYLEVASELWIGGYLQKFVPTPFTDEDNLQNISGGCGTVLNNFVSGSQGYVSLRFRRPFTGVLTIPSTTIINLYGSRVSGSYSTTPLATVSLSATVTVPQSCKINAGQIINVDFGQLNSTSLQVKGEGPTGYTPRNVDLTLDCSNISDGVKVNLSVQATSDASDPTAISSSKEGIGIRMKDREGNTVGPDKGILPVTMDYKTQRGTSSFTAEPINTTGKRPSAGSFTGTATLNVEMQ